MKNQEPQLDLAGFIAAMADHARALPDIADVTVSANGIAFVRTDAAASERIEIKLYAASFFHDYQHGAPLDEAIARGLRTVAESSSRLDASASYETSAPRLRLKMEPRDRAFDQVGRMAVPGRAVGDLVPCVVVDSPLGIGYVLPRHLSEWGVDEATAIAQADANTRELFRRELSRVPRPEALQLGDADAFGALYRWTAMSAEVGEGLISGYEASLLLYGDLLRSIAPAGDFVVVAAPDRDTLLFGRIDQPMMAVPMSLVIKAMWVHATYKLAPDVFRLVGTRLRPMVTGLMGSR